MLSLLVESISTLDTAMWSHGIREKMEEKTEGRNGMKLDTLVVVVLEVTTLLNVIPRNIIEMGEN